MISSDMFLVFYNNSEDSSLANALQVKIWKSNLAPNLL